MDIVLTTAVDGEDKGEEIRGVEIEEEFIVDTDGPDDFIKRMNRQSGLRVE
jgi:hypothetical protein